MQRFSDLLHRARGGSAVLFCGAGFTADCLNFDDSEKLGVSTHLLRILNEDLARNSKTSGFSVIQNAAKRYKVDLGQHRLMVLLKERFKLNKISSSIADVLHFPWSKIYTTNYDNGIELGLQGCGKKFVSVNNTDERPDDSKAIPIIHLHGYTESWTDQNFEASCVLDSDSYRQLTGVKRWLEELRRDVERAQVVVFVGFSANDFHLNQVFYDVSGLKEKAFFINPPKATPNPDEVAVQEEFGTPVPIGREEFGVMLLDVLTSQDRLEPNLASFRRHEAVRASDSVPLFQILKIF